MTRESPDLPWSTRHTPGASLIVHGGLIQLSGLYARSSACTDTEPSALTRISRVARGRWAVSRPT